MQRIMIVEDDEIISGEVEKYLKNWGYHVKCIKDFGSVIEEFADFNPHLVLMDISLPYYNGYYWCEEIRKVSKVPIIFISSAADNMNIIMAMNMGGDDFIPKPFELSVLLAKVQAVLRRTYDFGGQTSLLEHRGAILDIGNQTLTFEGEQIELTKNEFKILKKLLENKEKTVSRDTIMMTLWESDSFVDDNTLTVNMTRLRKKLDNAGMKDFIKTKKGLGYYVG
ncbi:MAG: response regulator transcription factor [Lachnospiraceae bacterium]|nr:response regulator transcription factor [Lachnospiraceae bacterium]